MHPPLTPLPLLDRRRRLLRRSAWLCALLVLVVGSLSAFLRQSGAGLGCTPWPACHARAARVQEIQTPPSTAERAARAAHRASASSLLVLLLAMAGLAWTGKQRRAAEGRLVLTALALVFFLALLGLITAGARTPTVTLGNLLAGMVLFAVCVRLAVRPSAMAAPARRRVRRWALLAGATLVLQIGLGALVSAGYAGLSCPQLAHCSPGANGWAALNPWHLPSAGAGEPGYAAGVGVHMLHRLSTLGVVLALGALALHGWRAGERRGAALLVGLAALAVSQGIALVLAGLPLSTALAHNLLAALLLGTVAALAARAAPLSPRL